MTFLYQQFFPTQSICYFVRLATNMLQYKIKTLKIVYPFCMFLIKFWLLHCKLRCMIVRIQYKLFSHHVMSPLLQCLNNCMEFLIRRGIFSFSVIQFLTKICHSSVILTQYSTYSFSIGIVFYLKWLAKVRKNQDWFLCDLLL